MNGQQDDFLSTLYSVRTVIEKFKSTWTANTVFAASYALYLTKVAAIEQNRDAQMINSKGITVDKNVKRSSLAEKSLFIVNRIRSYANVTANNELLESVHYTQSSFDKCRDAEIVGMVDIIIAKANANVTALATYGVTAALITELQKALAAYSACIAQPRTIKAQTKNATENLAVLFKETNDILTKRLDLDIEVFKTSKPDFYSQYQTARVIIATSGKTVSVLSRVTNAETGEPIKGVTITFIAERSDSLKAATTETTKPIVKKSAEKGGVRLSLAESAYRVVFEKIGFKKKELPIKVASGETTKLNVELEKE